MENNPGYYHKLLQYSKLIPCPSENQIKLDLKRTFPEEKQCMSEKFLEKLKNILVCYSIRNTTVGYCQGMNFIGGRLLLIMGNEEQAFWLFIQIMEEILPITYYSELVGIVVETTMVENILGLYFPDLYKFIVDSNFNIPLRNFIHKWMVCLFTQNLSPEMVYTFLDFFFLEGRDLLIKNSLFIFSCIHDNLMKSDDFEYMYNIFNSGTLNIHDIYTMIYFLDEKKFDLNPESIEICRKKLEIPVISKFKEESLEGFDEKFEERKNTLQSKGIYCNTNWPTCMYDDYNSKIIDVLILKERKSPYIIQDYYYIKNDTYPVINIEGVDDFLEFKNKSNPKVKDVLVERHKHVCDNEILVDNAKILIDNDYKQEELDLDIENDDDENNKENEIYDKLKNAEDFDNVVKEIKTELSKKIKPMKINEINNMIQINEKKKKYYPDDYIFFVLE